MKDVLCNDKFLVTLAVLILGVGGYIWGYLTGVSAENIITAIVSGLFGMAAGRQMARGTDINGKAANENGGGKTERTGGGA